MAPGAEASSGAAMAATRLELNLMRLLSRCEALAAERRDPEEWRLEKVRPPSPSRPSAPGHRVRGLSNRAGERCGVKLTALARQGISLMLSLKVLFLPSVCGCSGGHAPGAEEAVQVSALGACCGFVRQGTRLQGVPGEVYVEYQEKVIH